MNIKELIFGGGVKTAGGGAWRDSIQAWLPIKNIINGVVITRDNRFVKILEVLPVNIYLKSPNDRQNIIASYAAYLKIAPDSLQLEARFSDDFILKLLYEIINKRTRQRVKLPEGVFDMTTAVHGIYE